MLFFLGLDDTIYLQHEQQQALDQQLAYAASGCNQYSISAPITQSGGIYAESVGQKGFDFTAAQHVPPFSLFGNVPGDFN